MPPVDPRQISRLCKGPALPAPARLDLRLSENLRGSWPELFAELPVLSGRPITLRLRTSLAACRGRLVPSGKETGIAVYAACFIRERKILVDKDLLRAPDVFRLILVHELFHFVWPRLGNGARTDFERLLLQENTGAARGELGESSAVGKELWKERRSRKGWREYVCESFCDTAAWLYSGVRVNPWFTLRGRWRERRRSWFEAHASAGHWRC